LESHPRIRTHKSHNLSHSPFHIKNIGSLDSNDTVLATKLRKDDIRAIHLHDLSHLVKTSEQDIVQLGLGDGNIFGKSLDPNNEIPKPQLSIRDLIGELAGYDDFVFWSTSRTWWAVSINLRERRWEVYRRVRRGLDAGDVLTRAAAHESVHGQFHLHRVD
jgi:hypothetical protein